MRRLALLTLPLLAALLVGCPEPEHPGPEGAAGGDGGGDADGDGAGEDGGVGDDGAGGDAGEETWAVIPPDAELITDEKLGWGATLGPATTWPAPASLTPVGELAAAEEPEDVRVRLLEEQVAFLIKEDLRPKDPSAAAAVDAEGRLHMKLGRGKAIGSATIEIGEDYFMAVVQTDREQAKTLEELKELVGEVLVPELAAEIASEQAGLAQHPTYKGEYPFAANAMLERSGPFGMQFPYAYVVSGEGEVLVILQEVPHRSLEGEGD